jgi:N-acetylglucosamine-6-sulfatase
VALPDKPSFDRVDPSQPEHGDLRREYEDKLEALQAVDDLVAGLLAALEETGQAREHLVFLATDNGYLLGQHRLTKKSKPYE